MMFTNTLCTSDATLLPLIMVCILGRLSTLVIPDVNLLPLIMVCFPGRAITLVILDHVLQEGRVPEYPPGLAVLPVGGSDP